MKRATSSYRKHCIWCGSRQKVQDLSQEHFGRTSANELTEFAVQLAARTKHDIHQGHRSDEMEKEESRYPFTPFGSLCRVTAHAG